MNDLEKIKNDLKNNLSQYRYEHSLKVAEEAKDLAHHYNYDEDKAYLAGLVHDIAKEFNDEENKKWIEKYNLSQNLFLSEYKDIIHGEIGAVVVKDLYNLDGEICNAIKYHTIGNTSMTLLDKIIFVADKIGRINKIEEIEKEKSFAYENIDLAILLFLENSQKYLNSNGKQLHPESIKLMNKIKSNLK